MSDGPSRIVLVVDDEPLLRDAVRFEVEMLGCTVIEASSGHEAQRCLASQTIDLIISDVRMPDGDGIELLRYVTSNFPHIPLLLMSGFADIALWDAYHLGAHALLSKPFNFEYLGFCLMHALKIGNQAWAITPQTLSESIPKLAEGPICIGRGGMFVEGLQKFLAIDTTVAFIFEPSNTCKQGLKGTGVVRWVRERSSETLPIGCGVEFLSLSESTHSWVQSWLAEEKPQAYIPRSL